jgi:hypothetical protein
MGILNASPKLEPGEALLWKAKANYVAGPSFDVFDLSSSSSGQLVVTDRRVFFQPSRADSLFHPQRWDRPRDDVIRVEKIGRDADVFSAGMRERLGIRTEEGAEVFVVNNLEKRLVELQGFLGTP